MDVVTQKFIQEGVRNALEQRRLAWKNAEEKNQLLLTVLETRVSNAVLSSCNGITFRQALLDALNNNPEGPWVLDVRCMDMCAVGYDFAGFASKDHRIEYMKRLVNTYHSKELNRLFPTSTGWAFASHDCQTLKVTIPTPPEPDLLDMSIPCPFGLDESS